MTELGLVEKGPDGVYRYVEGQQPIHSLKEARESAKGASSPAVVVEVNAAPATTPVPVAAPAKSKGWLW
jgi:hypothetical protein